MYIHTYVHIYAYIEEGERGREGGEERLTETVRDYGSEGSCLHCGAGECGRRQRYGINQLIRLVLEQGHLLAILLRKLTPGKKVRVPAVTFWKRRGRSQAQTGDCYNYLWRSTYQWRHSLSALRGATSIWTAQPEDLVSMRSCSTDRTRGLSLPWRVVSTLDGHVWTQTYRISHKLQLYGRRRFYTQSLKQKCNKSDFNTFLWRHTIAKALRNIFSRNYSSKNSINYWIYNNNVSKRSRYFPLTQYCRNANISVYLESQLHHGVWTQLLRFEAALVQLVKLHVVELQFADAVLKLTSRCLDIWLAGSVQIEL